MMLFCRLGRSRGYARHARDRRERPKIQDQVNWSMQEEEEPLNSRRTGGRTTVCRSSSEVVFEAQVGIAFKRALAP